MVFYNFIVNLDWSGCLHNINLTKSIIDLGDKWMKVIDKNINSDFLKMIIVEVLTKNFNIESILFENGVIDEKSQIFLIKRYKDKEKTIIEPLKFKAQETSYTINNLSKEEYNLVKKIFIKLGYDIVLKNRKEILSLIQNQIICEKIFIKNRNSLNKIAIFLKIIYYFKNYDFFIFNLTTFSFSLLTIIKLVG